MYPHAQHFVVFLRQGLMRLKLTKEARMAGQQAPDVCLSFDLNNVSVRGTEEEERAPEEAPSLGR